MSRKPTLFTHAFTVGSILLLVFAILFVGLHFLQNYLEFRTNSQNLRKEYFESQQEKLAWEVHHFIELINTKQSNLAKESQIELETRANSAHTLLENLYKNYYQTMPKDEFTNLFVNVFRSLDSSNNSFEIFVVTPEFEELIKLPNAPSEASLLRQMYGYSQASSNGFYSYIKKSDSALEKRVAYLKNFKPLDLLIGISASPDTSKKQVQKELLRDIENLRFDLKGENYLFLGMWNGVALTPPSKGKNMLHIQDVNGKFIVKELIETAKSGGGFVEYVMPDLEGKRTQNKLSYVQGIPEWEWYVGAGIYTDDIDAQIEEKTKELHQNFFVSLITSMGLFLILTLTMGYFYRRLNAKIRADFTAFFEFFNSLAHFNYPIDKKELRFAEFETLALSANSMLEEKLTLERKLSHLAHHDHLTGLPNRALLSDRIHQSIKNAKRYNQQLALCFVDLDNFKKINDSFGHSYGDETLLQVSINSLTINLPFTS